MPTFLICGDPHGRFAHIVEAVRKDPPAAVILLGDVTPDRPLHEELSDILGETDVWWIPGNHDTDETRHYDNLFESALADRNLHGQIVEIAGERVAGLGGVFRGKIWTPDGAPSFASQADYLAHCGRGNRWRGGLPLRHRSTIFPEDLEAFRGQHADILVTHEGPDLHHHGSPALTRLAKDLQVNHAFHGHHHESIDYPGGVWHQVGIKQLYQLKIEA